MLWQSAAPGGRSPWRLGVLFRAHTCRFDEAHIKLGTPLTGGQHCIRHSGTAETRIILDRLNRRDRLGRAHLTPNFFKSPVSHHRRCAPSAPTQSDGSAWGEASCGFASRWSESPVCVGALAWPRCRGPNDHPCTVANFNHLEADTACVLIHFGLTSQTSVRQAARAAGVGASTDGPFRRRPRAGAP